MAKYELSDEDIQNLKEALNITLKQLGINFAKGILVLEQKLSTPIKEEVKKEPEEKKPEEKK